MRRFVCDRVIPLDQPVRRTRHLETDESAPTQSQTRSLRPVTYLFRRGRRVERQDETTVIE